MKKNYFVKACLLSIFLLLSLVTLAQRDTNSGDLYEGMTKNITPDKIIYPYGLQVSFYKTVHVIFPSSIISIDLGSNDIVAAKASGAENILRVKSAVETFDHETNLSVITADGNFYPFNVKYEQEPEKLNIEMKDFLHQPSSVKQPANQLELYLKELGNESPVLVNLIMQSIHKENKRLIKDIGVKKFDIQFLLKSIYTHNDMLYFHTQIRNSSHLNFDIDFLRFKIIDKKVPKRTAIQETIIYPMRAYNYETTVEGNKTVRTIHSLKRFTIPDNKILIVELYEKDGGRNLSFKVENSDIINAKEIKELKTK